MEFAVGLLALAFVAFEIVHYLDRRSLQEGFERERATWTEERGELLTRVQHPERVPTRPRSVERPAPNISPEARRRLAQVGTAAPQTVSDGD